MAESPLMQRWRRPEAVPLVEEITRRLGAGASLHDLRLDRVDGRLDLRGLPVPVARMPLESWRDVRIENVDLSHAWLSGARFHGMTFAGCVFDRADLSSARWWGCRLEDCSFVRANLNTAVLGGDAGVTTWRRCSLVSADLRHAVGRHAAFEGCRFDRAKLTAASLTSALVDCRFSGKLRTLHITGSELDGGQPLLDTDLTEADLSEVQFARVDLRLARLPPDGPDHLVVDNYLVRMQAARRALAALGTRAATFAAIPVDIGLRAPAPGQQVGVVSLSGMAPEERELLRDVLRRS